jgi:hypothetical protein
VFCFKLTGQVGLQVAATKVKIFIDIIATLLSMNLICQIGFTFHVVAPFFSLIITPLVILADDGLLVLKEACKASLSQLEEHHTDTFTITSL